MAAGEVRQICWWCGPWATDQENPHEAAWLINGVPICEKHTLEAVKGQLSERGWADIRELDWAGKPEEMGKKLLF